MTYLPSLPKTLGELSVDLLKTRGDNETRRQLGNLLCSIADCTSSIAMNVRNGEHSPSRCAELATYIGNIHRLIEGTMGKENADRLTLWLNYVDAVPGIARIDIERELKSETQPKWTVAGRFAQYEAIEEVAGIIRAFGNLVRVQPPEA